MEAAAVEFVMTGFMLISVLNRLIHCTPHDFKDLDKVGVNFPGGWCLCENIFSLKLSEFNLETVVQPEDF